MAFYNKLFKFYTTVGYGVETKTNQTIEQFLDSVPEDSNANLLFNALISMGVSNNLKISRIISNSEYFNRIDEAIRIVRKADHLESKEQFKEKYPTYIPLANGVGFDDGVFSITDSTNSSTITVNDGSITLNNKSGTGSITTDTLSFSPTSFGFRGQEPAVGVYTNVEPQTLGSGTGAKLTVTVVESVGDGMTIGGVITISGVTVTNGGENYSSNDTLTILTSQLGGSGGVPSLSTVTLSTDDLDLVEQTMVITRSGISMPNLPTTDPLVSGALYNSEGTLKISAGGGSIGGGRR